MSLPSGQKVYKKGSAVLMKYFDTGSNKWERWSGSGGQPYVTISEGDLDIRITGSDVPIGISGSMGLDVKQTGSGELLVVISGISGSTMVPIQVTTDGKLVCQVG